MLKKILLVLGGLVALVLLGGGGYVGVVVYKFNASMAKVYDVPPPALAASKDPAVIERGRHLAESVGACTNGDCHGPDLGGGKTIAMGPIGTFTGPNITAASPAGAYTDGELARLILHGVKKDGRSVRFMPAHEINWLPDDDLVAIISYVRTVPPVEKASGPMELGVLAKVLDRHDMIPIDIARRIDHGKRETAPPPAPTAAYGAFLARACTGCHGPTLSGGKIPGAPSEMAIPSNITPDATGLEKWTYADFEKLLATGVRPDGRKLDPMMPFESLGKMNDVEKQALWAYLQSVPAKKFGGR
jgi:mono/diheme cytochrome c family protein